jgi:hypothetical protein
MTDHAELIEALAVFAKEQDIKARDCLSRPYRAAFCNEAKLLRQAADAIGIIEAERAALIADICRVVDGARPYVDESGIVEIPLHTFGILFSIRRAADRRRPRLAQEPR